MTTLSFVVAAVIGCCPQGGAASDYTVEKKMEFEGHTDVASIQFSHDGKLMASASWDCTARIFDVATGKELRVLNHGANEKVFDVAFSADDKHVFTSTINAVITKWSVGGSSVGSVKAVMSEQMQKKSGASFLVMGGGLVLKPDGKTLITGTSQGHALIDPQAMRLMDWLPQFPCSTAIAFLPDGKRFVAGAPDGKIYLRDAATAVAVRTIGSHPCVSNLAMSPDGAMIAAAAFDSVPGRAPIDQQVKLWDVKGGKEVRTLKTGVFANDLQFAPKGGLLAFVGGSNGYVRLFDVTTGEEVWTAPESLGTEHQATIDFNHDATLLAGVGKKGKIVIWSIVKKTATKGK